VFYRLVQPRPQQRKWRQLVRYSLTRIDERAQIAQEGGFVNANWRLGDRHGFGSAAAGPLDCLLHSCVPPISRTSNKPSASSYQRRRTRGAVEQRSASLAEAAIFQS
jgi:hypothetical protein